MDAQTIEMDYGHVSNNNVDYGRVDHRNVDY